MQILFITNNYPSPARPFEGTFVQQFVWAMSRQGHECTVIKPTSIFARRYGPFPPRYSVEETGKEMTVEVYRPRYLSFSCRNLGFTHSGRWTQKAFNATARRMAKVIGKHWSAVYGHFLYQAGFGALNVAHQIGCQAIIGVGESQLWTLVAFGQERAKEHYAHGGFFLANSSQNRDRLVRELDIEPARILVEPNGVDLSNMYPRNRQLAREDLGFPADGFIVVFIGANEERKGPTRVIAAVEETSGVKCILAGMGTESLQSPCIIKKGPVSHARIPLLLSAADIFVLPTTSEGSCNAVIEAMACGLPIVTSIGQHMDDIVDANVAIRVDPMNVRQIRDAVLVLKRDPDLRRRMSKASLRKAKELDINERARRVSQWIDQTVLQSAGEKP